MDNPVGKIEKDKKLHFGVSAGIAAVVTFVAKAAAASPAMAIVAGVVVSLIAGIGKEVYDWLNPDKGTADWKDLVADVAGTVAGAVVGALSLLA